MAAPDDQDVDTVIGILGLDMRGDRRLVITALRAKDNNIEQVVNEYFDNPAKFHQQYSWDEDVFSGDRDGATDNHVPSFSIQPPDSNQIVQGIDPSYYHPGAPSRPPSRASNRSPISKLVDYTASNATGGPIPGSSEQEDADLQRAIAESVANSGIQSPHPPPQESGIAHGDTSLPFFGPANRTSYEQDQWAMVPISRGTPEPEPSRRKRGPGVPAFLRRWRDVSWDSHRLAAIVTILHAIPAARNALLRLGGPAENYGHTQEWWRGKPIVRPQAQPATDFGESAWADDAQVDWFEELHRLMAFLDATERSYGSVDILAETRPGGCPASTDPERDFFDFIRGDTAGVEDPAVLESTAEVVKVLGDEPGSVSRWTLLDLSMSREQLMMAADLYNIWDMTFWMDFSASADLDSARFAMITKPAEVLAIRFGGDDGFPTPLGIPRAFYIDRYLAVHKEQTSQLQRDMLTLAEGVARIQKAEEALTKFSDPENGATADRAGLCKAAISKNKEYMRRLRAVARWRRHEAAREAGEDAHYFPADSGPEPGGPDHHVDYTPEESRLMRSFEADIEFYQRKLVEIERKLQKMNAQRKACEEAFHELGSRFTVPSEEQAWNPTHGYSLRGIASSPDVFYVCLREAPDLMEVDASAGAFAPTDQWWKLGYVASSDDPIKTEMTTYERAVEEACGVGSKPILIYASEKALQEERNPLPSALQTFARFDNRLFRQELKDENPQEKKRGPFGSPLSPSKRRNRSDSIDSMATNLASAGDLDDDMRDAPFEVDDPFASAGGSSDNQEADLIDMSVPGESSGGHGQPPHAGPDTPAPEHPGPSSEPAELEGVPSSGDPPPELPNRPPHEEKTDLRPDGQEMQERGSASPFLPLATHNKTSTKPASVSMELDDV